MATIPTWLAMCWSVAFAFVVEDYGWHWALAGMFAAVIIAGACRVALHVWRNWSPLECEHERLKRWNERSVICTDCERLWHIDGKYRAAP